VLVGNLLVARSLFLKAQVQLQSQAVRVFRLLHGEVVEVVEVAGAAETPLVAQMAVQVVRVAEARGLFLLKVKLHARLLFVL
jgi:hypothetical protein